MVHMCVHMGQCVSQCCVSLRLCPNWSWHVQSVLMGSAASSLHGLCVCVWPGKSSEHRERSKQRQMRKQAGWQEQPRPPRPLHPSLLMSAQPSLCDSGHFTLWEGTPIAEGVQYITVWVASLGCCEEIGEHQAFCWSVHRFSFYWDIQWYLLQRNLGKNGNNGHEQPLYSKHVEQYISLNLWKIIFHQQFISTCQFGRWHDPSITAGCLCIKCHCIQCFGVFVREINVLFLSGSSCFVCDKTANMFPTAVSVSLVQSNI